MRRSFRRSACCQSVSDVTSVRTNRACPLAGGDVGGNRLAFLTSTSAMTTLAPSCANSRASASPMPWAPPVMIATLSFSRMFPPVELRPIIRWRSRSVQCAHGRGAAARRSRSLIARPRPAPGSASPRCRARPRTRHPRPACASRRTAVRRLRSDRQPSLRLNTAPAPGNGGPNASSASSCRTSSHPAAPAARRVMRRQQAGRSQRACSVGCHARTGPMTASIASTVTPPGRSSTGSSPDRSSTVDSTPTAHGPLSSTAAMRPDSSVQHMLRRGRTDLAGAVGRRRRDRPVDRRAATRSATSCAGTRTANVSSPALASRLTRQSGCRGSTSVSGPGQNAAASDARASFATTSANAASAARDNGRSAD